MSTTPTSHPPHLLGLYGNRMVGKDSIGAHLQAAYDFTVYSCAQHLYNIVSELFMIPVDDLKDRAIKELPLDSLYGKSPREVLKLFGTDFIRDNFSPDFWLDMVDRKIRHHQKLYRRVNPVITDISFLNEIKYVLDRGGYILYIERSGFNDIRIREEEHRAAETYLQVLLLEGDKHVVKVSNNGTLGELFIHLEEVLGTIGITAIK